MELNATYKEFYKDFKIEIKENKLNCLIGTNGSGKSLLARGLFLSNQDSFLLLQKLLNQIVKSYVYEEIKFGLENLCVDVDEIEVRISKICKELNIEKLKNKKMINLSGGELQKVLLASVLVLEPKILILDEALEMVDRESLDLIYSYFRKLKNMTIIYITHNIELIKKANWIIEIENMKIKDTRNKYENK